MVRIVRQYCYECNEPVVRTCERCEKWNARVRGFYAGDPDPELNAVFENFGLPRSR